VVKINGSVHIQAFGLLYRVDL